MISHHCSMAALLDFTITYCGSFTDYFGLTTLVSDTNNEITLYL
jgi:hypothetical protein